MKNNITVVIAGITGSGKTTIAHIISKALGEQGIKHIVKEQGEPFRVLSDPQWFEMLAAVAKNTEVDIKTVQVARNGKLVT